MVEKVADVVRVENIKNINGFFYGLSTMDHGQKIGEIETNG